MNKVYVITTTGCEGCRIMNNLVFEAIRQFNVKVNFENIDYNNFTKLLLNVKPTDFPTTVFTKDGEILEQITGTRPTPVILKLLQKHFQ